MSGRPEGGSPTHLDTALGHVMSRREFLRGSSKLAGVVLGAALVTKAGFNIADMVTEQQTPELSPTLEKQKAEFDRMSDPELAQWILDSTGDEATSDKPVRTPSYTDAYEDLKNTAEGKPAFRHTLLQLDGKKIKMDVEVNRDILMFRALLTVALRDPANYFEGKPILIQSGQLTNRSGSHSGRGDKSHFYGNSIDCSGAMKDGSKPDEDPNLYAFDSPKKPSPINQKLGRVLDMVGELVGVKTSGRLASLERVDSLHGEPGLSTSHYHFNASNESSRAHALAVRSSIFDQANMYFELNDPVLDLRSAAVSDEGRDFIHVYETFRGTTYGDAGNGRGTRTIGYGATYYLKGTVITRDEQEVTIENDGEKPRMGDTITEDEADRLSKEMIEREYMKPVVAALEKYGMLATQHQLNALVSYSYHRGGSNAAKLVGRLRELADAEHSNDGLAIRAAFMFDINSEVDARFRNGVTNRYLDTADIYIRGNYRRNNRSFDPSAWGVIIAAYFG